MPVPATDFSGEFQFDLENKLFLPSKQLYGAIKTEVSSLYQAIREILVEFHNTTAVYAQQLYNHPLETVTNWYDQTVSKSTELAAAVNDELIPELNALYESNVQKLQATNREWSEYIKDSTIKTHDFFVSFYENPMEMSEKIFENLLAKADVLATLSAEEFAQFKASALSIYQSFQIVLEQFIDAPMEMLEAMFYQTVSGILNMYYSLVSSTLELLAGTATTLV